ncbi:YitT family protein [uncultured Parolsenella sp.]|uniref:YitT family protein n=1 Tax=uncultured Parolsenella sp. TaxID=2083008 RepID=UPI0027D9815E|nr:YitT family protein [uncultured Parolsenella sp.]
MGDEARGHEQDTAEYDRNWSRDPHAMSSRDEIDPGRRDPHAYDAGRGHDADSAHAHGAHGHEGDRGHKAAKPGVPYEMSAVAEALNDPTGTFRPIDPARVRLEPLADAQSPEQAAEAKRIAEKREQAPRRWRFFLALNFSLIVMAFSIVLFQSPQHFAFGGTSGLAIVLASAVPVLPMAGWMWALNVLIVVVGFVFLPRRAVMWSAFASVALSMYTSLFAAVLPAQSITGDMWLDLCFAVLLPAVSSAIAFDVGGSTGGTDILAMIVNRKSSLDIGKALTVVNFGVVVTTFALYGTRVGLYCVLGLFAKTMVVDSIIESFHMRKICTIVCKHPREIERFIIVELNRTATLTYAYGAYSGRRMAQITCVLGRAEARRLLRHVRESEPDAFVTIVTSSEIVGRGFRFVG